MGAQSKMYLGVGKSPLIGAGTYMLSDGKADKDDNRGLLGP